jgi:hypothetical protein
MSTTFIDEKPTQALEPFKGVKKVPYNEYYTTAPVRAASLRKS